MSGSIGVAGEATTVGAIVGIGVAGVGAIWVGASVGKLACKPRLACSRAVANALILLKRRVGSLASAVSMTCSTSGEIVGILSLRGGTGVIICLTAISVNVP